MAQLETFDTLVLGSGEAGKYIAWHLATAGERVAVIERRYSGGSCPNIACLPSKNVVHSAKVVSYLRRSEEFGLALGPWHVDMSGVRARKRRMVDGLVAMHLGRYTTSGAGLMLGEGRFVGPKTLEVALAEGGSRTLHGKRVILSTGSQAAIDDAVPGLRDSHPLTHV